MQGYLTASNAEKYDGTTYSYNYLIRSGSTYVTASSPYWRSDALQPVILSSSLSEIKQILDTVGTAYGSYAYGSATYGSGSILKFAEVQDYLPRGIDNQRYSGAKMTSRNFNIASLDTVDGGPVVETTQTNPNQLRYTNNPGSQGSFILT